jgi:hypothetical protein
MTTPEGKATAGDGATTTAGAGDGQTSNAEVTELTAKLETSVALVATRDGELEVATKSITDLQAANQKFADDMAGLATQRQQLTDAQTALEESRKTSTDLTTKLEESNTTLSTLQGTVTSRRRQDLVKSGLPEDYVAGLDDAGLSTLESALPHITPAKPTGPKPNGTGYALDNGPGAIDVSKMSDAERSLKLIESLKTPK